MSQGHQVLFVVLIERVLDDVLDQFSLELIDDAAQITFLERRRPALLRSEMQ
jgi:hypothetical protein